MLNSLRKLREILSLIRVIRFEFVIHVYKEQEKSVEQEFSLLGTRERVQEMENKKKEYRRLQSIATTAYKEQVVSNALNLEHDREVDRGTNQ